MNSEEIQSLLIRLGFIEEVNHVNSKTVQLHHPHGGYPVYVKLRSRTTPLVIHPDYERQLRKLPMIPGVDLGGDLDGPRSLHYFNSTMRAFPHRINGGKSPEKFGIDVGFEGEMAGERFIRLVLLDADIDPTPLEDINNAEESLRGLTQTERECLIKARIGQGRFRDDLINSWRACSATGVKNIEMLRASHIKPWRDCTNGERLDEFNGLLLSPNLDQAFDRGLISFRDTGEIMISSRLPPEDAQLLGIREDIKIRGLGIQHARYLQWHRDEVYKA